MRGAAGPANGGIGALPVGSLVSLWLRREPPSERTTETRMLSATRPPISVGSRFAGRLTAPPSAPRSRFSSGPPATTRIKISQPIAELQLLPRFLLFSCIDHFRLNCKLQIADWAGVF